ncbi:GroES-like protein [Rhizodiscina lignyota]|uniref:GroES-like protein n=1 Tax=Rhizodiscina lignyota TaxID=1504668 RepID=A0A9P4ILV3_9PEZI|nr:GroES-like protein [Rhizodiscina lignyota]
MSTHPAVVAVKPRAPLEIRNVPTVKPGKGEIRVKNEWTASTPLDLHQADGGLLIAEWPHLLGDGVVGPVVEVGEGVDNLTVGDQVFGFTWRTAKEKGHQKYVTSDAFLFGKLPPGIEPQAAVTLPNNAVTAWHTINVELGIDLPWPKPANFSPKEAESPFLVWGGSSSVGQFSIQLLKYYGFRNILTTASKRHTDYLKELGAAQVFDYNDPGVIETIVHARGDKAIPYIIDSIGSLDGSIRPLSKIATKGSKVAVMLPVVVRDATASLEPVYAMDVTENVHWAEGVDVTGVRTHFYLKKLQPEVIPTLLAEGSLKPNRQKIIEGPTLLARAQASMDALRNKEASGERLVWRVSDD